MREYRSFVKVLLDNDKQALENCNAHSVHHVIVASRLEHRTITTLVRSLYISDRCVSLAG